MANAYYGAGARLAHPCHDWKKQKFICPICQAEFDTESPMENHYLGHNPTQEEAKEIVRWNRFGKHFNTPEHQKQEAEKRKKRVVTKYMKANGWNVIPRRSMFRGLGFHFVKGDDLKRMEEAIEMYNLADFGQ